MPEEMPQWAKDRTRPGEVKVRLGEVERVMGYEAEKINDLGYELVAESLQTMLRLVRLHKETLT